ncbi:hypothetical protein AOB54_02870 [beta proteobacterium MWH-UniP1]
MKLIDLSQQYASRLHCPFCGEEVVDEDKAPDTNPCAHTLYIATDDGFEYIAPDLKEYAVKNNLGDGEMIGVHQSIENIPYGNSFGFTVNPPPPPCLCLHVGFRGEIVE